MYAKIFAQIFDSSIAENYQVRHVFEDLLKLAEVDGCVDMTMEAIARRTNVPLLIIKKGIESLCRADPKSRSKEEQGRRLVLIDPSRGWGWQIVNYAKYRAIQDQERRRATWRKASQKYYLQKNGKLKKKLPPLPGQRAYDQAMADGDEDSAERIVEQSLP